MLTPGEPMAEARYLFMLAQANRDDAQLHVEITALAIGGFIGVAGSALSVEVLFAAPITGPDYTRVETAVTSHVKDPQGDVKRERAAAILASQTKESLGRLHRVIVLLTLGELNVLRAWDASLKAAVAASTSFADLKVRIAALSATPARTVAQLKTAVENRINAGDTDVP